MFGLSSASNTATKLPRAKGKAALNAFGFVRGSSLGAAIIVKDGPRLSLSSARPRLRIVRLDNKVDVEQLFRIVQCLKGFD